MDRHKWADVIIAMANGENIEYEKPWGEFWIEPTDTAVNPISMSHWNWRIKPRTIMIGDMEVPEPLKTPPEEGVSYFTVSIDTGCLCFESQSIGEEYSNEWFDRGLCHLTKEAAITHAKALIKVSGGTV